jgi:excisionase family DNA binding protein
LMEDPRSPERSAGGVSGGELLDVEEVAGYLGLAPATVWRWCREGRLPCMKIGKRWRVRREALEDFIRRSERPVTLAGELGAFVRVPDSLLAIAGSPGLLSWLEAAFAKVAEARDGLLVRFYSGAEAGEELRERLESGGLDVERLEREGRLYFEEEQDAGRVEELRRFLSGRAGSGRTVWVGFDWDGNLDPEPALRQQQSLAEMAGSVRLVIMTALPEEIASGWPAATLRKVQAAHPGAVWLSEDGLLLSRTRPLPGA